MAAALVLPADLAFPIRLIRCALPIEDARTMLGIPVGGLMRVWAYSGPTPIFGIGDPAANHPSRRHVQPLNVRALAVFGADDSVFRDVTMFGDVIMFGIDGDDVVDAPDWLVAGFAEVVR
jgi:hypothetical protein